MLKVFSLMFTKPDAEKLHDEARKKTAANGGRVSAEDNDQTTIKVNESVDMLSVLLAQTLAAYSNSPSDGKGSESKV